MARCAGLDAGATPSEVPFERWLALFNTALKFRRGQAIVASGDAHRRPRGIQATPAKEHRSRTRREIAALSVRGRSAGDD